MRSQMRSARCTPAYCDLMGSAMSTSSIGSCTSRLSSSAMPPSMRMGVPFIGTGSESTKPRQTYCGWSPRHISRYARRARGPLPTITRLRTPPVIPRSVSMCPMRRTISVFAVTPTKKSAVVSKRKARLTLVAGKMSATSAPRRQAPMTRSVSSSQLMMRRAS